ncbi:NeuD/PglB/VioB family sugar acetyltransferase [Citrobacter amalonaticus]|uniref:NeuD/PglB/VioB family sugar acetyltransferase n=1 Tax=Citrobacter amalonaticus TaxID=35703 RepID=UPI00200ACE34|nr:NeuD/PglB/VioB family sugar acetyltransferase [Citrobacter amalonaticus]MCK8152295.1 NeuD/PglB/VioB family sugar acetyltransferase [Citrobacter amalonaticus]
MYNKIYGIFGASGFGREVLPLVRQLLESDDAIYFIDIELRLESVNGVNVISYSDFLNIEAEIKFATIAIANADIRQKIEKELLRDKVTILNVIADNVVIMDDVKIGYGAILCPFVTLTSNIKIGRSFHANIYSYVAHDCIIGDYVTFAPSVKCNGNVVIEDHVYVGTGAMIKQGTKDKPLVIGEGAIIGMGAVVTKNVKAGDVVFGCPAKSIKRGA